MKWLLGSVLMTALVSGLASPVRAADDKEVQAILDKGIKALGGADKLGAKAFTWKVKGKVTFNGNDNEFTATTTVEGLDHYRSEFKGEFGGNEVKGVTVVCGDKGWRSFGEKMELEGDTLANEKRRVYLQLIPTTLVPLKGKGFKVKAAGDEKVGGKPAAVLLVTPPDGKDFKLFLDRDSGLPVKLVAKVLDFMGQEYTEETTIGGYKDVGGIKKATKVESKRDGEKFIESEISDFKPLEKVDAKTFKEPE